MDIQEGFIGSYEVCSSKLKNIKLKRQYFSTTT